MLLKWIVCRVLDSNHEEFSEAQQMWGSIRHLPGFLSQFGGWDTRNADSACIMGMWEDDFSYQNFMTNYHNEIIDENKQEQSYESLTTSFYHDILEIPGNSTTSGEALDKSSWIRIAECVVKPNKVEHFFQAQKDIWNLGMAQVEGMHGGYFCKNTTQDNSYLVLSFWKDRESHQYYLDQIFPELRQLSLVSEDVVSLIGRFIELKNGWKVKG